MREPHFADFMLGLTAGAGIGVIVVVIYATQQASRRSRRPFR